jgi:hypothetical protein
MWGIELGQNIFFQKIISVHIKKIFKDFYSRCDGLKLSGTLAVSLSFAC